MPRIFVQMQVDPGLGVPQVDATTLILGQMGQVRNMVCHDQRRDLVERLAARINEEAEE